MKTILCYGDSNTHGSPPYENMPRYGPEVRWGSVLRTILGEGYWVVEEGLGGRTTVFPDPIEGEHKSGKTYLLPCLESHRPIDLVILMLGTNDLKHKFGLSAWDIAAGAGMLVDLMLGSTCGPDDKAPRVLLMCPPPVGKLSGVFVEMFAGAPEKSRELAGFYEQVAQERRCEFLDAGQIIVSSDGDGIHLDASEQQKLGKAVAAKVKAIFG